MAGQRRDNPPDLGSMPQEIQDTIGGFLDFHDRAQLRLVSKKVGAGFRSQFFRSVQFNDVTRRVVQELQLFCAVAEDEKRHEKRQSHRLHPVFMAESVRSATIVLLKPADIVLGEPRSWAAGLNIPRGFHSSDPAIPSIICHTVSLMTNCTHLHLVIGHSDSKNEAGRLAGILLGSEPWQKVTSLRISAHKLVEQMIMYRMVPSLEHLQISDFLAGCEDGLGIRSDECLTGYGLRFAKLLLGHRLRRLHLEVGKSPLVPPQIFPPIQLFKFLVEGFPVLEWLGVDVRCDTNAQPVLTWNRNELPVQQVKDLGTVLAGFNGLKRLALTVRTADMMRVCDYPVGVGDSTWALLFHTLASKLSETRDVEMAILSDRPTMYLRHWDTSKDRFMVTRHVAGERRGWPVSNENEITDAPFTYDCYVDVSEDEDEDVA